MHSTQVHKDVWERGSKRNQIKILRGGGGVERREDRDMEGDSAEWTAPTFTGHSVEMVKLQPAGEDQAGKGKE